MKGISRRDMERKLDVRKETVRKIGCTVRTDESTRAVLVNKAELRTWRWRCRGRKRVRACDEAAF